MDNLITRTTELAMSVTLAYIRKGDTVVDATCGTGRDTLALAEAAGAEGAVYAFDIQEEALRLTEERLRGHGVANARLLKKSFASMSEEIPDGSASAVVFNLGYLPGGDHGITTTADETVEGLKCALAAIRRGGIVTVVMLGVLSSPGTHTAKLIVAGLVIGCVADVLLNLRMVFEEKGQAVFLVGILVFLSGHIMYLAAVLPLCKNWLLCVAAGIVLTALLMIWIFRQITAKKAFKIFGVFYIGAIMILNCVAVGNLIADPSAFNKMFAAGAALFLISDIVLILNTFGPEFRRSLRVTNISLYYAGQILIALSLGVLA